MSQLPDTPAVRALRDAVVSTGSQLRTLADSIAGGHPKVANYLYAQAASADLLARHKKTIEAFLGNDTAEASEAIRLCLRARTGA